MMISHDYELKNENIIKQENANEFIGIKIKNGQPYVYVPYTFRISNDINKRNKNLLMFLRSISLATKQNENIQTSHKEGNQWPVDSYLWIIYDFIDNGFYYNREKTYFNGTNGKIDWKKTLKHTPVYSNGNVIYTEIVSSKVSPANDNISEIYKYCVMVSSQRIGWLFNFRLKLPFIQRLSINEMKYIVRKELNSTFDDIKRLRFNHMLKILSYIDDSTLNSLYHTYGIENYYYVFERMIDQYFKGISQNEISRYYPHGQWHLLPDLSKSIPSSELRPDTIHKRTDIHGKKYTYIIDAKMYKYGGFDHSENPSYGLPETTSIQKQITYGEYIKNFIDSERYVRNTFVLPFNKELDRFKNEFSSIEYLDKNRNLAFIGYCTGNWRTQYKSDRKLEEYEYVFTFLIDFNYLLMNYHKDNKDIEKMFDKIEETLQCL